MPPPLSSIVCIKASEPDGLAFEPVRRSRQNAIIKGRQAALNEQATAVKLPTFKHVLQQIKVAASCVNTDFWLHKIASLAAKQIFLAWAAQHLQILPAKSRTTVYSLQQLFASSNLICCKTGLNVGGKTFAFQLVFRQCWKQDRCQFVARFTAAPIDRAGWITNFFWICYAGYSPFAHLH